MTTPNASTVVFSSVLFITYFYGPKALVVTNTTTTNTGVNKSGYTTRGRGKE